MILTLARAVTLVLMLLSGGMVVFAVASRDSQFATVLPSSVGVFFTFFCSYGILTRPRRRTKAFAAAAKDPVSPIHPLIEPPTDLPGRAAAGKTLPIQMIRDLLGPQPRSFPRKLGHYLRIDPPAWLVKYPNDELAQTYPRQHEMRSNGPVVWAAIVQANSLLFKPGPTDCPASIIYSEDAWFDGRPEQLLAIARRLFGLKNTDPSDPEAATFARVLTNERVRAPKLPVPPSLSGGRAIYHSSLMVTRKHLPSGWLTGSILPVWLDPSGDGNVLLVPAAYWPPSLLNSWDPHN